MVAYSLTEKGAANGVTKLRGVHDKASADLLSGDFLKISNVQLVKRLRATRWEPACLPEQKTNDPKTNLKASPWTSTLQQCFMKKVGGVDENTIFHMNYFIAKLQGRNKRCFPLGF